MIHSLIHKEGHKANFQQVFSWIWLVNFRWTNTFSFCRRKNQMRKKNNSRIHRKLFLQWICLHIENRVQRKCAISFFMGLSMVQFRLLYTLYFFFRWLHVYEHKKWFRRKFETEMPTGRFDWTWQFIMKRMREKKTRLRISRGYKFMHK